MVSTPAGAEAEANIAAFMSKTFPNAKLLQEPIAGTFKYEVSTRDVEAHGGLSTVLSTLQEHQKPLQITDWGMTETTLEEVFLKIVEMEARNAETATVSPAGVAPLEIEPAP